MLKAWRRVRDYIKYDLREIIAPTSLPYPPGEEPPGNERENFLQILRLATRDYLETWKSEEPEKIQQTEEQQETPLSEDLVGVAKSGAESVKPVLQQLYRTRAAAYQEAVRSFVQGYREGFAGLPDSDDDSANESPPGSAAPDQATAPAAPMKGNNAARQDATMRMDAKREAVLDRDGTPSEAGTQQEAV
ncbi:g8691 [Coccomyxa elongata]